MAKTQKKILPTIAKTQEEILRTIVASRDSIWEIENTIAKLDGGETPSLELKSNIDRNVKHLKLVVSDQEIIDSGEDISDLQASITIGEAKLADNIWNIEV